MRTTGRAERPVDLEVIGEIDESDLPRLDESRPLGEVPQIQRIRDSHHSLARCLAVGMSHGEAAAAAGYTIARVSTLLNDPTFRNLLLCYRKELDQGTAAYMETFHSVGNRFLMKNITLGEEIIDDALDGVGPKPTLREIRENIELFADRLGYGKTSTQVQMTGNLGDMIDAARRDYMASQGALALPPAPHSVEHEGATSTSEESTIRPQGGSCPPDSPASEPSVSSQAFGRAETLQAVGACSPEGETPDLGAEASDTRPPSLEVGDEQ